MLGSHLGWFSLGGNYMQIPSMAMLEALTSPTHKQVVERLADLVSARMESRILDYFSLGALVFDVDNLSYVWTLDGKALLTTCNPDVDVVTRTFKLNLSEHIMSYWVDVFIFDDKSWNLAHKHVVTDEIEIHRVVAPGTCSIYEIAPHDVMQDTDDTVLAWY